MVTTEEEEEKIVFLEFGIASLCQNLHRFDVVVVVVGIGESFGFLPLLYGALNLELDEGFDDEDESYEDPDSDPCCDFPLPAFNQYAFSYWLVVIDSSHFYSLLVLLLPHLSATDTILILVLASPKTCSCHSIF
ncbi:hypothetical protein Lalb_Chr03g0031041 [Lupinus albus]|uniref:Uncharacterized protein n=1 Tax=Lupinus albus TaxID=3870 RepID=A0A6A4QRT9_LUPAL|nr:hypothetical protein Lalb_Chr03g0031041 [Lupinus albus]